MPEKLPNIEDALKIEVTKSGDEFRADALMLPGTSPVGRGKTEGDAKYNLLVNFLYIIANNQHGEKHGGDHSYAQIVLNLVEENWDGAFK